MRLRRFRITWLMILVAIAALNFGAIRALSEYRGPIAAGHLAIGGFPMANALAVGLLIGHRRRGNRRFLWGFEAFGATALALYIALTCRFAEELVHPYLKVAIDPLRATIRPFRSTPRLLIAYSLLSLWACLPQLTFAVIGGFLCRAEYTGKPRL
jgi:hypothetical protein